MTKVGLRATALAGAASLAVLTTVWGGSALNSNASASDDVSKQSESRITEDGEFDSTLTLEDGRQVEFRLVEEKGLLERHRDDESASWTSWQTVYSTDTDRCQGVELSEQNGTVAVIADFGRYCYDGEPPTESIAAVATGDLSDWEHDMTEDFDGWQKAVHSDKGSTVTFERESDMGHSSLVWQKDAGFGEPEFPREAARR